MSKVRLATVDDLDLCVQIAADFHRNSPYKVIPFEIDRAIEVIRHAVSGGGIVLLSGDDGLLVGIKVALPFSTEDIATEICWWVKKDNPRRLRALKDLQEAFEYWARNVAKVKVTLSACFDETHWFSNRGYDKAETMYITELK